jgi:thiamine-monophosphate kinase
LSSPGNDTPVEDAGERGLIDRIRRRLPAPPSSVVVGIGDDAAVAIPERGEFQVLTTDSLVEGIHFDRRFSTPEDIGYKALAVNVSDVAAMGATPRLALLSLILPSGTTLGTIDGLIDGIVEMAGAARVAVIGGNITRSPGPLVVDVTVTGSVRPRKVLTRGGGRAGDALYVTGAIGAAAAGLEWLQRSATGGGPLAPDDTGLAECVARHRRPEPRTRVGSLLGRNRAASACMDLSDGLADAVRQVAEASGLGASIDVATLPLHPAATRWFEAAGRDAVAAAVAGGDDYELLFAVPKRTRSRLRTVVRHARGLAITRIGELTPEPDVVLVRPDGTRTPLGGGFVHF